MWPSVNPQTLEEFHQRLSLASDAAKRRLALENFIAGFGYDRFLLGAAPTHEMGPVADLFFTSNMDEDWKAEYRTEGYSADDVTVEYCLRNNRPLLWSELRSATAVASMTDRQAHMASRAQDAGYRVGVTVPLHISWNVHTFGMSFCRKGATDYNGHDEMFELYGNSIVAAARLFLTCFDLVEQFKERYGLTPTEWSVLLTSLSVETNAQIGEKHNRSTETVKAHWSRIRTKLGVNSKEKAQELLMLTGAVPRPTKR